MAREPSPRDRLVSAFDPLRTVGSGGIPTDMKVPTVITAALLLAGCATEEQLERDRLIDAIEARVKLPQSAWKLSDYARYYAFDEQGMVVGIYIRGYEWPDPDDTCGELLRDGSIREVTCPSSPKGDRILAGQRSWVTSKDQLPMIMDGGCSVVSLLYDPKSNSVKSVECNGEA